MKDEGGVREGEEGRQSEERGHERGREVGRGRTMRTVGRRREEFGAPDVDLLKKTEDARLLCVAMRFVVAILDLNRGSDPHSDA